MAAKANCRKSGIFWMNGDDEQPLGIVPGLGGEVNTKTSLDLAPGSKRGTKMRIRGISNSKIETTGGKKQNHRQIERFGVCTPDSVSVHNSATVASHSPAIGTFHLSTPVISESSRDKSMPSLRDLCPEDKRRIANLIEELARVSEEKEESIQRLKNEQESFESKIQQLEQQHTVIAQERESLQQQYRECKELLGLYQQYLSQQQAKLNESIAQLSQEQEHINVASVEDVTSKTFSSRSDGSQLDGSYFSATQSQQTQFYKSGCRGRGAIQNVGNPASLPFAGDFGPTEGPFGSQKRQHGDLHSECHNRSANHQDSGRRKDQPICDNGSHLENSHHDAFHQHECKSLNATGLKANEALTRPELGHEDWEERRHQLLLQKMQLEVERERLQLRLAEQEGKLKSKNQLCQLHFDHSSVHENAEHPAGQSLPEKHSQTEHTPVDSGNAWRLSTEAMEQSRKDISRSPRQPSLSKPIEVSVIPETPESWSDFSMVELLDIFTPVSASELNRLTTQGPQTLQGPALSDPTPVGRSLLIPTRPYPSFYQQDLEESRILEDIFFIC